MRAATYASTTANSSVSGVFGTRCATQMPKGDTTTPHNAINPAAL